MHQLKEAQLSQGSRPTRIHNYQQRNSRKEEEQVLFRLRGNLHTGGGRHTVDVVVLRETTVFALSIEQKQQRLSVQQLGVTEAASSIGEREGQQKRGRQRGDT
jgi:hypothetical protein